MKPPYSEDAEQAVLSAAFMDPNALTLARTIVSPAAFYRSAHAKMFAAFLGLADRGEVPDPLTLSAYLEAQGELDAVGGKDFIGYMVDVVPTAANVEYHAKIVREKAERRNVIAIGERLIEGALDLKQTPDNVAQQATSDLLPVAAHTKSKGFVHIGEVMISVFEDIMKRRSNDTGLSGITWGYDALDFETGGIREGELAFVCGVPGSGKTAAVLNMATRQAMRRVRVAIVSAEMGIKALVERILNASAGINSKQSRKGEISDEEWNLMVKIGVGLKGLPLTIDDTAQPNIQDVVAKCRAEKAKHPDLKVIVVDFIQLLQSKEDDNRSLELTQISYALKGLAKELEVAIIVTCQVDAAAVEKTEDKQPRLHHLRWSQAMREAGDFVCLIKNTQQYDPSGPSRLETHWEKARELPVFHVNLRWVADIMAVDDMLVRAVA